MIDKDDDCLNILRLDWPGILTHPFWSGQLSHLVRPQTGVTKKSVNHNDTPGIFLRKLFSNINQQKFRSTTNFISISDYRSTGIECLV